MDINQALNQGKQRQKITAADPGTVVALARSGASELVPSEKRNTPEYWALEECITRFENASRAHSGTMLTST